MNLLNWIKEEIHDLFSKIPVQIKLFSADALPIVKAIKDALESNTAITVVDLIPGIWDDALLKAVTALLEDTYLLLQKIKLDVDVQPTTIAKALNNEYNGLHSQLIALQDGNKLPENRYDYFAQLAYSHTK